MDYNKIQLKINKQTIVSYIQFENAISRLRTIWLDVSIICAGGFIVSPIITIPTNRQYITRRNARPKSPLDGT